jgi:hypothetical protein
MDRKLLGEAQEQDRIVQQLFALGLAMKTTQGWLRQPTVAVRMANHVSSIRSIIEDINADAGPADSENEVAASAS